MKRLLFKIWGSLPIPLSLRWALIWSTTPKYLVGVVGLVLNARGEVLLFRHTYRGAYPWGLPSGWLEPREDPARAIVREIKEESGLDVRAGAPLLIENNAYVRRLDLIFFCEQLGGEFRESDEVAAAGFFRVDDLPAMHSTQKAVIRRAVAAAQQLEK